MTQFKKIVMSTKKNLTCKARIIVSYDGVNIDGINSYGEVKTQNHDDVFVSPLDM
jgi:hypothetical protein